MPYDAPTELQAGRLPDEAAIALVRKNATPIDGDPRKAKCAERLAIYNEDHVPLIVENLHSTQSDPEKRKETAKFASTIINPALDVTRETCVVWKQGARRSIEGVNEDQLAAFQDLVIESWIDVHAPEWNRLAKFVGPLIVIPEIAKGELVWCLLLPTIYDVVPDPERPNDTPLAVAWSIGDTGPTAKRSPNEITHAVLDGHSWRYYAAASANVVLVKEVVHGLGYFPGEELRFDLAYGSDRFNYCRNQRLVDATIAASRVDAVLGFTRKAQHAKLLTLIGELEGWPKKQRLDPEVPLVADTGEKGSQALSVSALDFDTSARNSIDHAMWIVSQVAGAYGGQVVVQNAWSGARIAFSYESLTEIRNEQIPYARRFEARIWPKAVAVCRALRHPLLLPDPEAVAEGFRVDFGTLSRSAADPQSEATHFDWLLSKGCTDQIEILRNMGNTTLNDQQLKTLLEAHLEVQAWFNDAVTKRNLGMNNRQDVQTAAQANGALGPMVRDKKPGADAPEPDGNDDGGEGSGNADG